MNGRAEIVGTVTDPSGAVVPGADVELRSVASGKIRPATTDASGRFTSGLPKGDYVIEVTQQDQSSCTDAHASRCVTGPCSPQYCRLVKSLRRLRWRQERSSSRQRTRNLQVCPVS